MEIKIKEYNTAVTVECPDGSCFKDVLSMFLTSCITLGYSPKTVVNGIKDIVTDYDYEYGERKN